MRGVVENAEKERNGTVSDNRQQTEYRTIAGSSVYDDATVKEIYSPFIVGLSHAISRASMGIATLPLVDSLLSKAA